MVCEIGRSRKYTDSRNALEKFLTKNFGSINPEARTILTRGRLITDGLTIAPQIAGTSLGSISFGSRDDNSVLGLELNSLTNSVLNDVTTSIAELGIDRLFLHFDELDQGLDRIDETRARMLIGLILAAREISRSALFRANISPIVYLRSDIWEQISFSDKNKITRSGSIILNWDEETLLSLVNTRVAAKLGVGKTWSDISDAQKMRGSQPKFLHILARTFMRPRDVIQFLNEALKIAKARDDDLLYFVNDDINSAREAYSAYLRDELADEISPHWDSWLDGLNACSKTETITFRKSDFLISYKRMKSAKNKVDAETALENLFRFSVVGYERRIAGGGSGWSFRYLDADAAWDASAPRYKVHQGLKEIAKLREERN